MSDDLSGFSLMDLFRSEAEGQTATLSAGLLALEEGVVQSPTLIEPMMRAAHSLKGAARIVGLDAAVKVAHVLEDCFVAVQEGRCQLGPSDVDVLLRGVDLLTQVSALAEDQIGVWYVENEATVDMVVSEVTAIVSGGGPQGAQRDEVTKLAGGVSSLRPPPAHPLQGGKTPLHPSFSPPCKGGAGGGESQPDEAQSAPPSRAARPKELPGTEVRQKTFQPPAPAPDSADIAPSPSLSPEPVDRVVRVTAESLTRLMGLAGESLVESRRLRPLVDSLVALKRQHSELLSTLQTLQDRQGDVAVAHEVLLRSKAQASRCAQLLGDRTEELEDFARRGEDLSGRLHHEVLTSRMRPLADGVRGFPRTVRDIARTLGKTVKFEVIGENTGVDRDILDKLEAPLNHLIRNALDHALEMPDEREAAGKPATGTIRLEARHRAGMLQVTLSDDGRGIDPARLRVKIVERGLATAAMAGRLSEPELLEFLFLPGFSTREKVTEISGRGVGLDVVQTMVRAVGGVVRVASQLGRGTRFTLQLPITMSVIRALLVRISGEPYAFPLNRIDRIVMPAKSALLTLEGRQHFMMDGEAVGLVEACQVLERPPGERAGTDLPVVVASDRSHRFGVVVDAILGERDLEVRPLDTRLGKVPNINSASVLEDGWPVLIFDVEDLVRSVDNLLSGRRLRALSGSEPGGENGTGPKPRRRVLVVDDSITVRELERQLLESRGYAVEVAVDGIDGWNAVRSGTYDLVVSDVDMPRLDGIELVTRIKSDPALRSTPVVIVSYKDREEDRMRGLDAGANAYLTKSSFHDRTFLSTVFDLIGEAAP